MPPSESGLTLAGLAESLRVSGEETDGRIQTLTGQVDPAVTADPVVPPDSDF